MNAKIKIMSVAIKEVPAIPAVPGNDPQPSAPVYTIGFKPEGDDFWASQGPGIEMKWDVQSIDGLTPGQIYDISITPAQE